MRIFDLALKDLVQVFRDRRALFFLAGMPIVFTLFMGYAYRSGGEATPADGRLVLGWVNLDPGGALTQALQARLEASAALTLIALEAPEATEAVRDGVADGVLIVPAGFSTHPGPLTLMADPAVPEGQALFQLVRGPVTQVASAVEIGRLSAAALGQAGDSAERAAAQAAALAAWATVDNTARVVVVRAVAAERAPWYGDNPYNQASPGILVQFAIFGLVSSGQILMQERKAQTLQRLITTAMSPWAIIGGHLLAMFTVVLGQIALLVVFGQVALGVNYAREPLGTALISITLALWVAAVGLLIGVVAKEDSQVVLLALMAMFLFSALGGTWFPLEAASGLYATLGRLMPSAWAMTGYQNILIRGLGLNAAWLPAGVLALYAGAFFGLAVWRFRAHVT